MLVFSAADFEDFRQPRPDMPPEMEGDLEAVVRILAASVLLAALGRLTADATATYFEHLAAAAVLWITGTALWVGRLAPAWARTDAGSAGER